MTKQTENYWYLASYPKSGNTWCRIFIAELQRLASGKHTGEINLNKDINTGTINSSRHWLCDQLGVNTCDLSYAELDSLRGQAGETDLLYSGGFRYHKVHDAFISPDSKNRPVVCTKNCKGAIYISRHPEDIAVSISHFYKWGLEQCVASLFNPNAALVENNTGCVPQVRQHLGRWDQHVNSWLDQSQIPVLAIRYEDMLNKSQETFTQIAEFLGLDHTTDLISQAIKNTSIRKLRNLEEKTIGGFAEKPTSCDYFFRSGRSGEGAEQLSFEQRQRLFNSLKQGMTRMGYEGPGSIPSTNNQPQSL